VSPFGRRPGRQIQSSAVQCAARKSSGTQVDGSAGVRLACWAPPPPPTPTHPPPPPPPPTPPPPTPLRGILTALQGHDCLAHRIIAGPSSPAPDPAMTETQSGPSAGKIELAQETVCG